MPAYGGISPGYSPHWDGEILYSPLATWENAVQRPYKKPIEFDLSFTGHETATFRSRGQKPRVHSLGIYSNSRSSEYRPVPCCLETRGVNGEIARERE